MARVEARTFEDFSVPVIWLNGRATWAASHVARALGHERADQVTNLASRESSELLDGADYVVLAGEDLAALKAAAPDLVDKRAPSLMLLTESGVHLVSMLTRQPAGVRLRRWLAAEVLPEIRRTGAYASPTALLPTAGGPVVSQLLVSLTTSAGDPDARVTLAQIDAVLVAAGAPAELRAALAGVGREVQVLRQRSARLTEIERRSKVRGRQVADPWPARVVARAAARAAAWRGAGLPARGSRARARLAGRVGARGRDRSGEPGLLRGAPGGVRLALGPGRARPARRRVRRGCPVRLTPREQSIAEIIGLTAGLDDNDVEQVKTFARAMFFTATPRAPAPAGKVIDLGEARRSRASGRPG